MSTEKERYYANIKNIEDQIDKYKRTIHQVKIDIQILNKELIDAKKCCKHKFDNGTSALKRKGYWTSNISSELNSYTGDYEDVDNGYTSYYDECLICGYEIE